MAKVDAADFIRTQSVDKDLVAAFIGKCGVGVVNSLKIVG